MPFSCEGSEGQDRTVGLTEIKVTNKDYWAGYIYLENWKEISLVDVFFICKVFGNSMFIRLVINGRINRLV